jgi:Flp pilus assembly protein TadD
MEARIDSPPVAHRLNLRVLRFRTDPLRDEPAMLAQELLATGRYAEAIELTAASLEDDPHDADLLLTHGVALARVGELGFAQLALMRAAKAEPGWAEPWRHLAEVLLLRERPEQCLQVLERARELEPEPGDEALAGLQRAAELEVRTKRYLAEAGGEEPTMLAQELLAAGRAEAAFEVTRTALLEELDDEDLLVTHARAARARGDLDEALGVLHTAAVAAPDWAEVWRLLAEVHEERGEPERAREAAAEALLADPTDESLMRLHRRLEAAAETLVTL